MVGLGLAWFALCRIGAAVPAQPFLAGLASVPMPVQPAAPDTLRWLFESCVGSGPLKMGIPGVAAQIFFFSPLIEMRTIIQEKTTSKMPMLPFSAMCVNGAMWMTYGLLIGQPAIWVPNIPALVMGTLYTAIFALHVPRGADWLPRTRDHHVKGIGLLVGGTAAIAKALDRQTAGTVIGLGACTICVIMFSGPLVAIQTVLKEKSTRSLSFPMTLATVLNCALWTYYGLFMVHDPFVYVPNIMGLSAGITMVLLFAKFGIGGSAKENAKA